MVLNLDFYFEIKYILPIIFQKRKTDLYNIKKPGKSFQVWYIYFFNTKRERTEREGDKEEIKNMISDKPV